MLEEIHKDENGQLLMGIHTVSGEKYYLSLGETCKIHPIADDMVLAHKDMQNGSGHLVIADAEDGLVPAHGLGTITTATAPPMSA